MRAQPEPIEPLPAPPPVRLDHRPNQTPTLALQPKGKWKLPRDGGGALTSSGIMFAAAFGLAVTAMSLAPHAYFENEGFMGAGAAVLGAGGACALGFGLAARRSYRATELGQTPNRPRTGRGLHVASAITMTAGSLTLLAAQVLLFTPSPASDENEVESVYSDEGGHSFMEIGLIATGAGLVVIGSAMLVVSQVRRTKFRKWMEQRSTRSSPSFAVGRDGVQLGLTGRF